MIPRQGRQWIRGGSVFGSVLTGIFGRKTSKKGHKHSRRSKKARSSESSVSNSSSGTRKKLTQQTKDLISAIQEHVVPLLESKNKKSEEFISKNRVLFALNRAAQRSLKRDDVFGNLNQLKAEAKEANKIVAEFLDCREQQGKDSCASVSLIAPKCALCGSPCRKCVGSLSLIAIV